MKISLECKDLIIEKTLELFLKRSFGDEKRL